LLGELIGWGIYILPVALIVFGIWLVLRKIERIPPLSPERAVGSILIFSLVINRHAHGHSCAEDGAGSGSGWSWRRLYRRLFERLLWFS